jgi:hypothetical protein
MGISLKDIVNTIKEICEHSGLSPSEVKLKDLTDSGISERQIRNHGGLTAIKDAYFPQTDKELKSIAQVGETKGYIKKLEKTVGAKELLRDRIVEVLKTTIKPLKVTKSKVRKSKKVNTELVEFVGMLNDTHIGVIIDEEEIGGINSFDFKQACRRFAFYTKEVINYKKHKRAQVKKLHLILNGDLIAGIIHGLETKGIHLMVHQLNAALHIFTHVIQNLSQEYSVIEVHGLAGNHDRMIHKNHGKRAVGEVYDSYANSIFYGLSVAFRDYKNISFNFPKTPYGFINLPAGRAMFAHGDHVFSGALGNPGKAINVKGLTEFIRNFNAGEISKGKEPIKLLLLGHVHVFAHFITTDGVEVYISPCLSGLDSFAHSLTINNNFVAQPIFESTKDFILGDCRLIRLNTADNIVELDSIIPVYDKELKYTKEKK